MPCVPLTPSSWRAAFWFSAQRGWSWGGEKVLAVVCGVRSLTSPRVPLFSVSDWLILSFPCVFLSLSLTHMPQLAGGFVCFITWCKPSCTDVLPGLQFLAFAWSGLPLQDHQPWWRGSIWQLLIRHGAPVPRHPPSHLPLPLSSWVLLWNKGSCQEGESIIALAQGATFNVSAQMEKRAQHYKSTVM